MTSVSFGNENTGVQVGVNHGPIYVGKDPSGRPETCSPTSTVPYARDSDFVKRAVLLEEIQTKALGPGNWVALVGLGGVGLANTQAIAWLTAVILMAISKSQLAIEYSYRLRDEHPKTWIFWVHASNAARFEESFHEIADRLKIPNRQDAGANIFALVYDWLQSNENWMVILDNLDDDGFLHERRATGHGGQQANQSSTTERPLASFLPRGSKGTMVITTRSRDCALRIVDYNKLIEVPPMNTADAVALLRTKLQLPAEDMDVERLAKTLDHMPLAIVQAAAYIRRRSPRYSVSRFLHEFEGSDERKSKLLGYEAGHSQRDRDATNSILLSWQMSFDHLQTIRSSAADLLSLMSFFDPNGVSEDLRLSSKSATWPAEDGRT